MSPTPPADPQSPAEGGADLSRPDSREALLVAARQLFAEQGFERTTMRVLAARAGVDPALIYHYFPGGKKALLAATLTIPAPLPQLMAGVAADPDRAGTELVRRALAAWDEHPEIRQQGVAVMRIAVGSRTAGQTMRPALQAFVLGLVGSALRPDHRELRAGLVLAQMHGLLMHRYLLELPPLATTSPADITAVLGPVLQHYMTGDLGDPPDSAG